MIRTRTLIKITIIIMSYITMGHGLVVEEIISNDMPNEEPVLPEQVMGTLITPYAVSWANLIGTAGYDQGLAVSADVLGNVFISGYTDGSLGGPNAGLEDAFVSKCNPAGDIVWARQLGTAETERSRDASVDGQGNVFITGNTGGSLGKPNAGLYDAFLSKYDTSGNLLWIRQLGTNGYDYGHGVSADTMGNVYITGTTEGSLGGPSAGNIDTFVGKFNSEGDLLWLRQYGTNRFDIGNGVSTDGLGNVYITGSTDGSLGGPNAGEQDVFVSKFDSVGNLLWTRQHGTSNTDISKCVSADSLGNVYISGYTEGSLGGTNAGKFDAFVSKYDSTGNLLWMHQLGTSEYDESRGVSAGAAGNVFIAGYTKGLLGETGFDRSDAFVGKYDSSGHLLWVLQFGTDGYDMGLDISTDGLGNLYTSGFTSRSMDTPHAGIYDAFIAKLQREPSTIYVDIHALGANNGSSWNDAYKYLQDALAVAIDGDEIRVAQGTYRPDENTTHPGGTGDRPATFQLKSGVAVYGGFRGVMATPPPPPPFPFSQITEEVDPNDRDITAYKTILSGDLRGDDGPNFANNGDNSYNVVTGSDCNQTAIIDGFTITGGNANGDSPSWKYSNGAGIYNRDGNPTIRNCTFTGNSAKYSGAGMSNFLSSPTITDCIFNGNYASRDGGGIQNKEHSKPTLINCTFNGNSAITHGGGMDNTFSSEPNLINCTFSLNSAGYGGGMYNHWSNPTLIHCTFSTNSAVDWGGAIFNWDVTPILTNCIFNNNSASDWGGAICNWGESNPILVGCLFSGNSAESGGGMFNLGTTMPILANCTFTANSAANGNALACDSFSQEHPSILQITNCIIFDGNEGIWNNDNSAITVTQSDVQGGWPGQGNIDADPCFVDHGFWDPNGTWMEGDYHLLQASACINTADNNSLPTDIQDLDGDGNTVEQLPFDLDGNSRVVYDVVDMGAYEFVNKAPIAVAGPDQTAECACNTEQGTGVTLDGTNSSDPDRGPVTYTWTGPFVESPIQSASPTVTLEGGCPGEYIITLVVNDGIEDSEPNEVVITVVDTTSPEFELSVLPTMLWPPNHKMVEITPTWMVSDECDASPDVSLVSVVANEGDDIIGDGHTTDDIQIGDDGSIFVRSERSGPNTGRIYTITYQAVDDCGNVTVRSATVSIPHELKLLARMGQRWLWRNHTGNIAEDLNGDGIVDLKDIATFANNWIR